MRKVPLTTEEFSRANQIGAADKPGVHRETQHLVAVVACGPQCEQRSGWAVPTSGRDIDRARAAPYVLSCASTQKVVCVTLCGFIAPCL